ncbi:MAG: hypothetical protein NT136_00310 [Candidatus Moranbacteria bacterium]|nr:hypothetical protein [Candidatus Moranbacteria bacterium]
MAKKVFIISFVALLVILLFWGVYNFAFKEKKAGSPEIVKKEEKAAPEKKQEKSKEKIYPLTDEAVISPTISKDGEHITYYTRSNGNVYEVTLKGTNKRMTSSEDLKGLENVFWSPDKNKVISVFNKEGKTIFYLYDYTTQEGKRLKDGIDSIAWTNLGDKIIYKHFNSQTKKRSINIANPDGSNWEKLADTTLRFISLTPVLQTSLISFWNAPNGFEETSLQIVGVTGGETKTIFSKKFGADYLWSPNGEKALVSSAEAKGSSKIMLAVINSNGGGYQNLSIPTLTSKRLSRKKGYN